MQPFQKKIFVYMLKQSKMKPDGARFKRTLRSQHLKFLPAFLLPLARSSESGSLSVLLPS
jgi:hypothetical protein